MTVRETANLGVDSFLKGIAPHEDELTEGWYESGRRPHRADGRPSRSDFLPKGLFASQTIHEEEITMATTPSVKTPGADLGTTKPKGGPQNNLNKQTGTTPPKPGNSLK